MSAGTIDTTEVGTSTGITGETQFDVPANASAVTVLEEGTDGQGSQGGAAGLMMETLPISNGSLVTPGGAIYSETNCGGGGGGTGFNGVLGSGSSGTAGGVCSYVRTTSEVNPVPQLFGVAGGGGGQGGGFSGVSGGYGGSMGSNGGQAPQSSGGTVGSGGADVCDLGVVPEAGGNGSNGSSGGGAGGGGGGGGGGGCLSGSGGAGGNNVGGDGGGGGSNYVSKSSGTYGYSDVASYTPNTSSYSQIEFIIGVPPVITTPDSTVFTANTANTFTIGEPGVTPDADPPTALSQAGTLPQNVNFTDNGDGTATLSGNPPPSADGTYSFTVTSSSALTSVSQAFTLTAQSPPAITSANTASFTVQQPGDFSVTTSGYPAPALSRSGALPSGVTFTDNNNGTATLGARPTPAPTGPTRSRSPRAAPTW